MNYYLPINSESLSHYFSCVCVKPAKYFDNKPQDIQDRFSNTLLISNKLGTKDTDCCLEIVLTENEQKYLIPCGEGFYLFPTPLPISRVKKVYFREQQQLDRTLMNINLSAAFIPKSLAKVTDFCDGSYDDIQVDDNLGVKDYSHQIELFDRILGALALMKTAKEPYMNYSENYASMLSFFNASVKEEMGRQGLKINEKFFGLFSRSDSFIQFLPFLEKKITKEDLDSIAADNKQRIERSSLTKTINYDKLSGKTYTLAILQSYGVGEEAATKKIDDLISSSFAGLKEGTREGIALYYGYNRGYSVFCNSYGNRESRGQDVKYLLDSKLDYYTIESVYQFVFYSVKSSATFSYIDDWCPRKNQRPSRRNEYIILDTVFIGKKKPSVFSKDYLQIVLADIKSFDYLNGTLAMLIDRIRIKVAEDAKEEIEDTSECRIAEVESKWSALYNKSLSEPMSLKEHIAGQDAIIADLQRQNDDLHKEIDQLKTASTTQPRTVEDNSYILNPVETESVSSPREQELKPSNNQSLIINSKAGAPKKNRSNSRKSKPKPVLEEDSQGAASPDVASSIPLDIQISDKDNVPHPQCETYEGMSLFDSNE